MGLESSYEDRRHTGSFKIGYSTFVKDIIKYPEVAEFGPKIRRCLQDYARIITS